MRTDDMIITLQGVINRKQKLTIRHVEELVSILDTYRREERVITPLRIKEAYRRGAEVGANENVEDVLKVLEEQKDAIDADVYEDMYNEIYRMKG